MKGLGSFTWQLHLYIYIYILLHMVEIRKNIMDILSIITLETEWHVPSSNASPRMASFLPIFVLYAGFPNCGH